MMPKRLANFSTWTAHDFSSHSTGPRQPTQPYPAGEAASPLTPALYNYEHAFVVGGDAADRWWLCPDTPEESKEWLAALNNRRRS